jgi:hypothetical protein
VAVVGSTGRQHRGLPSLYTPAEVQVWRVRRRLKVNEMALLLGWPVSTLSKKLNGHLALTLDLDRQIEGIDAQASAGMIPPGAPLWLQRRILARSGW